MRNTVVSIILVFSMQALKGQVSYSPAWFGPNANPVPEFTNGTIPGKTTLTLMADYYFGFGDRTKNGFVKVEVPLIPERVSFNVWSTVLEHYETTKEVSIHRNVLNGTTSGKANGDIYVQTRISILREKKSLPFVILNSTLKSASGTNSEERRYFDTPGYYFDVEFGKSIPVRSQLVSKIKFVADLGFLCWQATAAQDDAPMYGIKIIVEKDRWSLENTLAGYHGWMHANKNYWPDYGDTPLVNSTKLTIPTSRLNYFAQYQVGIKDFPYRQIRLGMSFALGKLTPRF